MTFFEALAASEQNNLVRLAVEREALARDQDRFNLRDRFSSTFAFEQGLGNGLSPIAALQNAQQNSTLGGFQQLFGTQLNAQSGLAGLQRQQQANQGASLLTDLIRQLSGGAMASNTNVPTFNLTDDQSPAQPFTPSNFNSGFGSAQDVFRVGGGNSAQAIA